MMVITVFVAILITVVCALLAQLGVVLVQPKQGWETFAWALFFSVFMLSCMAYYVYRAIKSHRAENSQVGA